MVFSFRFWWFGNSKYTEGVPMALNFLPRKITPLYGLYSVLGIVYWRCPLKGNLHTNLDFTAQITHSGSLGFIPFTSLQGQLYFDLISTHYERENTIVPSNKRPEKRRKVFGDAAVATVSLDHLLHLYAHAHPRRKLQTDGGNFKFVLEVTELSPGTSSCNHQITHRRAWEK